RAEVDGTVKERDRKQAATGKLDLEPRTQLRRRPPGVDVPFVAVAREPGPEQQERSRAVPGGKIGAELASHLLQDAEQVELVRLLFAQLVAPADVEALAPAKPDASGDSASRAQDAGAVRADRPRGDDVLDGEGDAVLDEGAPRVGRAGAGVSPVVGRGNRVGVN